MGCEGCARAILLLFNLILFLVGAACIGVGIWTIVDGVVFLEVLGNIPNSAVYGSLMVDAAYIIIGAGAVILIISFFGCCGAWLKKQWMLFTYAVIVGVLLGLQIAVVVVAYFFYDNVIGIVNTELALALNDTYDSTFASTSVKGEYTYTPGSILSKGIDAIQIEFSCCGVHNYTDYPGGSYPATCCNSTVTDLKMLVDTLWAETMTTYSISDPACYTNSSIIENTPGCSAAITKYVEEYSLVVMIIAGATMGVQLLLIMFSCCLFCAIRKEENKH